MRAYALYRGPSFSPRSRKYWVSSTGESFLASMRLASSVTGRKASSSVGIDILRDFPKLLGFFRHVCSRADSFRVRPEASGKGQARRHCRGRRRAGDRVGAARVRKACEGRTSGRRRNGCRIDRESSGYALRLRRGFRERAWLCPQAAALERPCWMAQKGARDGPRPPQVPAHSAVVMWWWSVPLLGQPWPGQRRGRRDERIRGGRGLAAWLSEV